MGRLYTPCSDCEKRSDTESDMADMEMMDDHVPDNSSVDTSILRQHLAEAHGVHIPGGCEDDDDDDDDDDHHTGQLAKAGQELMTSVVEWIVCADMKVCSVQHRGFVNMLAVLGCEAPSPRKVATAIIYRYNTEKVRVMAAVAECVACSLSLDVWTNFEQVQYVAVTCHFVNADFQVKNYLLGVTSIWPEETPGETLEYLDKVVSEWNIGAKIVSITTGSNAEVVKAVEDWTSSRQPDQKVAHIRCFAEVLNMAVKDGLDSIAGFVSEVRRLVWSTSTQWNTKAKAEFRGICQENGLVNLPKLVNDNKLCWISTHKMLDRALAFRVALTAYAKKQNRDYKCVTCPEQWVVAEAVVRVIEQFKVAAEIMSANQYPALTSVRHIVAVLLTRLQMAKTSFSDNATIASELKEEFSRIVGKMETHLAEYVKSASSLVSLAAFMDPWRKNLLSELPVELDSAAFPPHDVAQAELRDYFQELQTDSPSPRSDVQPVEKKARIDDFFAPLAQPAVPFMQTLDAYVAASIPVVADAQPNLAEWWQTYCKLAASNLEPLARRLLPVPATATSSENCFWSIVQYAHVTVEDDTVPASMSLKTWIQDKFIGDNPFKDESEDDDDEDEEI